MPFGLPWSEDFIREISDPEIRHEFVRDQIRVRLALLIRALREQSGREWSQTELGKRMGKPQSVVSRIEDPDYGKVSLQTLFEIAEAFELPLWVDIPEWDEWLRRIKDIQRDKLCRESFDADTLIEKAQTAKSGSCLDIAYLNEWNLPSKPRPSTGDGPSIPKPTSPSSVEDAGIQIVAG